MLFFCLHLAILLTVAARSTNHAPTENGTEHNLVGERFVNYLTDFAPHPFIIMFYDPVGGTIYGHGLAVSSKWVLTRARDAEEVKNLKSSVFMYQNIANADTMTPANIAYTMGEIMVHPDYVVNSIEHDIAMIQVCQKLVVTVVATIPPLSQAYDVGTIVNLFVGAGDSSRIEWGDIIVTENYHCDANTDFGTFYPDFHYCLYSFGIWVGSDISLGKTPFVLTSDNKLIGLVMDTKKPSPDFTSVLKIETQRPWLTSQFPFLV